ncbi:hypothetical protein H0V99_01415 [Candidatus Saccharibacteria bacterium]|nr:hypothetical protein [Candidatus Saccharibacteria bacterium]
MAYYQTLEEALNNLFELRVRVDTRQFILNFNAVKGFEAQEMKLLKHITELKNEIVEVSHDNR